MGYQLMIIYRRPLYSRHVTLNMSPSPYETCSSRAKTRLLLQSRVGSSLFTLLPLCTG